MTIFSLRVAIVSDASALAAIHATSFSQPWNQQAFDQFLQEPRCGCLLAEQYGQKAAFLLWRRVLDEAEIITFAVLPEYRRLGIARRLLAAMKEQLKATGVQRCFLEVSEDNLAAVKLYCNAAFSSVGRRTAYYATDAGQSGDALVMECLL